MVNPFQLLPSVVLDDFFRIILLFQNTHVSENLFQTFSMLSEYLSKNA